MSSSYCSSCKIELPNDDTIRDHYKGEFHRYNVKRKLVDLPPATMDQFNKKKAQLVVESSTSDKDQLLKCEPCGKSFAAKATYKQHLESKKHRENLDKFNEKVKEPAREEEAKDQGPLKTTAEDQNVCLFCNKLSDNIEENLVHMRLSHSFFISEIKHLKDLQGLLRYLGAKVHRKKQCIQCGNSISKESKTGEGVQQHMLAKGHMFMNTEDFGEYQRYYDFSKVYENLKSKNLIEEGDAAIPEEEEEFEEERSNESGEEESWEVIEGEETEGKRNFNWKVKAAQFTPTGELLLPNGQVVGHRQYKHVYKQYYRDAARGDSMNTSQLEYLNDSTVALREEENRLMAVQNEIMKKERVKVDHQVHRYVNKSQRNELKASIKANKILHMVRTDTM